MKTPPTFLRVSTLLFFLSAITLLVLYRCGTFQKSQKGLADQGPMPSYTREPWFQARSFEGLLDTALTMIKRNNAHLSSSKSGIPWIYPPTLRGADTLFALDVLRMRYAFKHEPAFRSFRKKEASVPKTDQDLSYLYGRPFMFYAPKTADSVFYWINTRFDPAELDSLPENRQHQFKYHLYMVARHIGQGEYYVLNPSEEKGEPKHRRMQPGYLTRLDTVLTLKRKYDEKLLHGIDLF